MRRDSIVRSLPGVVASFVPATTARMPSPSVSNGGGRYVLLEADAPVVELATFSGGPDISCYTPAAARELSLTIERSETIHGNVVPRWSTTVVCAFVESTRAVCWQYSPDSHAFEKIGEWTT